MLSERQVRDERTLFMPGHSSHDEHCVSAGSDVLHVLIISHLSMSTYIDVIRPNCPFQCYSHTFRLCLYRSPLDTYSCSRENISHASGHSIDSFQKSTQKRQMFTYSTIEACNRSILFWYFAPNDYLPSFTSRCSPVACFLCLCVCVYVSCAHAHVYFPNRKTNINWRRTKENHFYTKRWSLAIECLFESCGVFKTQTIFQPVFLFSVRNLMWKRDYLFI